MTVIFNYLWSVRRLPEFSRQLVWTSSEVTRILLGYAHVEASLSLLVTSIWDQVTLRNSSHTEYLVKKRQRCNKLFHKLCNVLVNTIPETFRHFNVYAHGNTLTLVMPMHSRSFSTNIFQPRSFECGRNAWPITVRRALWTFLRDWWIMTFYHCSVVLFSYLLLYISFGIFIYIYYYYLWVFKYSYIHIACKSTVNFIYL